MAEFMVFLAKASLCMLLFYGLYYLIMRTGTHFRQNRFYLLTAILFSLLIPLSAFNIASGGNSETITQVLQTVQIFPDQQVVNAMPYLFSDILFYVYLAGLLFFLLRFVLQLARILDIRVNATPGEIRGTKVMFCEQRIAPFSFFSSIYLSHSEKDNNDIERVLLHESVHIRQWHSIDVMLTELVCIIFWFNPAIWMIRSALKETHEYLADSGVKELTSDTAGYFQLLIASVIGAQPGLVNNFNKSLTLKRMKMMTKTPSGRFSRMRVLLVIPLLVVLVFSLSLRTGHAIPVITPHAVNESIAAGNNDTLQPQYPGGHEAMVKYMIENVKYPADAKKKGIQGKVYVSFTIQKNGKVTNVKVSEPVNALLDAEAVRVVSSMPDWIPGTVNGKSADMQVILPVQFKLQDK